MANIKDHVSVIREGQDLLPGGEGQDFWPKHAPTHESGGNDVINVSGLLGTLADPQNAGWVQGRAISTGTPNDGDTLVYASGSNSWVYAPPIPGASIWARDAGAGFLYPVTSSDRIRTGNGSAAFPGYAFLSGGTSGFFWDGHPALSLAGLKVWQFEHITNALTMTSNYRTAILSQYNGTVANSAASAEFGSRSSSSGNPAETTISAEHTSGFGRVDIHAISGGLDSAKIDLYAKADAGTDTSSYLTFGGTANGSGLRYLALGGTINSTPMLFDSVRFGMRSIDSAPAWTQDYLEFCEPGNTTQWTDYRNEFGQISLIQALNYDRANSVHSLSVDQGTPLYGDLKFYPGTNILITKVDADDGWQFDAVTGQATFLPNVVTTVAGDYVSGDIDSVRTLYDGDDYIVDEIAATPGFNIELDFASVTAFSLARLRLKYEGSGSHTPEVQIYNYDTTSWDYIGEFTLGLTYQVLEFQVPDSTDYVDGSGNAQLRIYHDEAGNPAHRILVDYVALVQSTLSTPVITDHGQLTGLTDDDHTQYILADGTRAFTGNVNIAGNQIVSGSIRLLHYTGGKLYLGQDSGSTTPEIDIEAQTQTNFSINNVDVGAFDSTGLDLHNHTIRNVSVLTFNQWPTVTVSGGAATVNFSSYQKATVNLNNSSTVTITLNTPPGPGNFMIELVQGGSTPTTTLNFATQGTYPLDEPSGGLTINTDTSGRTALGLYFTGSRWGVVGTPMQQLLAS